MDTKVVVTHWGALRGKYGEPGLARIRRAIDKLVAADADRGLETRVVGLDDPTDMRPFRARPMGGIEDREGAKRAVDAIDRKLLPHYILILGGPDVVPMQLLESLTGYIHAGEGGDQDPNIASDLPYACDMPYSTQAADFQGPTRAVGRLPDVPRAKSPAYLVRLLDFAAKATPLDPAEYASWFGVTTRAWKVSSERTVKRVFRDVGPLHSSPPAKSARWTKADLAARLHYVNCHGDLNDPGFYGDSGGDDAEQPEVLHAKRMKGMITPGTVLVAECCYGAQLYSPLASDGANQPGQAGIAYEYLGQGAHGVFGSSNVAYGPEDRNDYADVICRIFIERIRKGASLGRAALEARQGYLKSDRTLDPIKLKTIGQFFLLGDPSIHPIRRRGKAAQAITRKAADRGRLLDQQRARRRSTLRAEGEAMARVRKTLREEGVSSDISQQMLDIAKDFVMRGKLVRLFSLWAGKADYDAGSRSARARGAKEEVVTLISALTEAGGDGKSRGPRYVALVAKVRRGKVVDVKRVVSR